MNIALLCNVVLNLIVEHGTVLEFSSNVMVFMVTKVEIFDMGLKKDKEEQIKFILLKQNFWSVVWIEYIWAWTLQSYIKYAKL